jgi:hypothetical protein
MTGAAPAAPASGSSPGLLGFAGADKADGKAEIVSALPSAMKESAAAMSRQADGGAVQGQTELAGKKAKTAKAIRIVCLLPPDGELLDDLTRFLRRERAADIAIVALEPRAVREAFAPHRGRLADLPEPSHGWELTSRLHPDGFARLLDLLKARTTLRILEQPPPSPGLEGQPGPLDLTITLLR